MIAARQPSATPLCERPYSERPDAGTLEALLKEAEAREATTEWSAAKRLGVAILDAQHHTFARLTWIGAPARLSR